VLLAGLLVAIVGCKADSGRVDADADGVDCTSIFVLKVLSCLAHRECVQDGGLMVCAAGC